MDNCITPKYVNKEVSQPNIINEVKLQLSNKPNKTD